MSFVKNRNTFIFSVVGISFITFALTTTSASAATWYKLIDNGTPGYSETTNNWATWGCTGCPGLSYRYLSREVGDGSKQGTATWKTTIPYCGLYEVKVSARKSENRTSDADYYVTNSTGGEDHFSINQVDHRNPLYAIWDKLAGDQPGGYYYYEEGQEVLVRLDGTDDHASDCADAASWELIKQENCSPVVTPQNHLLLGTPPRR